MYVCVRVFCVLCENRDGLRCERSSDDDEGLEEKLENVGLLSLF